jgi:hypothetical protein
VFGWVSTVSAIPSSTLSFERDIKGLFREKDVRSMINARAFDLSLYESRAGRSAATFIDCACADPPRTGCRLHVGDTWEANRNSWSMSLALS